MRRLLLPLLAALALITPASAEGRPLPQAHAHNDYEHERPLYDALDHGFTSVEADIYLKDGELLVGHDPEDLKPGRTLRALYLDPLSKRRPGYPLQLLIDIKNSGADTYRVLDAELRRYPRLFTAYINGRVHPGPVTAVVSGDRPREVMAAQVDRRAFFDGRLPDLGVDARFAPLVSDNWANAFTWVGVGSMPAEQRQKLRAIVHTAHANGQRVRFWATPDRVGAARSAVWRELRDAGVDHINTDDLAGLAAFLQRR